MALDCTTINGNLLNIGCFKLFLNILPNVPLENRQEHPDLQLKFKNKFSNLYKF